MTMVLIAETTTLGVSRSVVSQTARERTVYDLPTPFGSVPVELAFVPDGSRRAKPEYDVRRTIVLERLLEEEKSG